jgi:hypothetical protein
MFVPKRLLPGVHFRSLFVLFICLVISAHGFGRERPSTPTTGKLSVQVVDAAGEPIGGAKVYVSIWTTEQDFQ